MSANDNLSEIIDSINPEEWLDYLGVKYRVSTGSSGRQLQVHECPRCHGREWKVYLNAETGLGNCFHGACVGEPGFNLFSFTKHIEGSAKQAYIELSEYAKSIGWRPKPKTKATQSVVTSGTVILPDSIELPQGKMNHPYLTQRGFSLETTAYFHFRYAREGDFLYTNAEGKRKCQSYDQRIIIPVFDLSGELVTFQGRDVTNKATKKYLFPPGLPGTARYLYNGHNAVGKSEIIINEGALDVAATLQAIREDASLGDVEPVGTFGKSLTMGSGDQKDQLTALYLLRDSGLKVITFMWDAEKKTLVDTAKAAEKLHQLGFHVRIARLPDDCDPNETAPDVVRRAFYKAFDVTKQTLLRFRLGMLCQS